MNREDIKFEIDQLKKNTMLFVLESMAVSLLSMVLIFGLGFVFPEINPYVVISWIVYVAVAYFAFAIIGNIVRWGKIMKLEDKLGKKGKK